MKYMELSEYFAARRGNQIALAQKVGCRQSTLSLLATGKRRPSPQLAAKLEAITGIPLRTLLGLSESGCSDDSVRPAAGVEE